MNRTWRSIRQHWWASAVIALMVVLAAVGGGYILVQQRLPLPWDDVYAIEVELPSAQALTPGQGQLVLVSGVPVGEISDVRLDDGRAVVTMRIERAKLATVHRDARVSVRPRTGLQDMNLELDPGDPRRPALADGARLPAAQATPQVQLDEVLSSLDSDARAAFQQLVDATAGGLGRDPAALRELIGLGTPVAHGADRILAEMEGRRRELRSLVGALRRLATAVAARDRALGATIDRAATTLTTIGGRDGDLRATLRLLPGTLGRARTALAGAGALADELRPASRALRPVVRDLRAALPALDPLLADLPGQLRPVRRAARLALPPLADLRATVDRLRPVLGDLGDVLGVTQRLANLLAYNPPGSEEGFLFWFAWTFHNVGSAFSTQDANRTINRGQVIVSCNSLAGEPLRPVVELLQGLGVCR
ncbi:MlaD family protein [Patulibacter defluvii]|uniref:MlaD family protein n=1 Tax=Patulibacter defluvii TaxID=3095358 RepID=UPI002A760670|nr:MlaD family protein [Patulibacter sp. DM4]